MPAIATWAAVTRGEIGLSPDSLFYWSAARTIYAEQWAATRISPLDASRTVGDERTPPDAPIASAQGSFAYPLTTWPPGYPLAVAAIMPLTHGSATAAARVLAVITLAMLAGAFALAASRLVDRRRAVLAAALAACLPFVHNTVRMMWSDALFTALALAALALAVRAFGPGGRPALALALAASVAAAATYVRYTGPLVLAAPMLVAGLVAIRDPRRHVLVAKAMLAIGLYGLLVAPLFARNLVLTGDLTGGLRRVAHNILLFGERTRGLQPPSDDSVPYLLGKLLAAFARGLVPWVGGGVPGPREALLSGGISLAAWGVAGAAVLLAIKRTGGLRPSPSPEPGQPPMALLLVVFAALYAAALLAVRAVWLIDFNTRMVLPAVASVALLAVCAVQRRLTDTQLLRVNGIAIAMTALVTITSLAAGDHYRKWRGFNHPGSVDRPVARWVRTALEADPGASVRVLSVGYLIPYLHYATGGAPVRSVPDVPEPSTLLAQAPGMTTLVILEPATGRFRCPEYQRAYEAVLDMAADSTFRGDSFTAWWLSGAAAARRLERGAREFTSLCTARP